MCENIKNNEKHYQIMPCLAFFDTRLLIFFPLRLLLFWHVFHAGRAARKEEHHHHHHHCVSSPWPKCQKHTFENKFPDFASILFFWAKLFLFCILPFDFDFLVRAPQIHIIFPSHTRLLIAWSLNTWKLNSKELSSL
ncbi:hypothetical protein BX661DRAFT_38742 [Kickxella alabastrina]|uniref:uncharacterized protein n=1 Tax=Kickxella alabastrina TaxID=61397 RepID=UPI002221135E|nr:uncharacterized protein BX661DRAFT_38742 [Kickxella alabastrina]KAI7825472.1 hypothetical protein BX661DRAFT_38742 [Kickxella alabastrina]